MSLQKLSGKIKSTLYRNQDNGYSIAKILTDDEAIHTVVGYFPVLAEDVFYEFFGTWITHATYGDQFKVESVSKSENQSISGLINYLSSSFFTGIGPKTAEMIVAKLGKDALKMIIDDHTVLKQISINASRSLKLKEQILENQANENMLIALYGYGFTGKLAMKLMQHYKNHTLSILEENPYQLIEDIEGIGFLRADEISEKLGIKKDDERRIKAGIMYAIEYIAYGKGDVYLTKSQLQNYTRLTLKIDISIDEQIEKLIAEHKIVCEEERYYLSKIYQAEISVSDFFKNHFNEQLLDIDIKYVETLIDMISLQLNIEYTNLQKEAILTAMKNPVSIITGGPGTGKSTIINGFIEVYQKYFKVDFKDDKHHEKFALMAPTGRAAKRMKEILDLQAKTIHKHLGYNYDGTYTFDKYQPMPYDLIIIDESSMIDIYLAQKLLEAVKSNAKIVIVGDVDQLPSVGPGAFLQDLIESNQIPTVRLKEIHRQASHSQIIKLAHQVNIQDVKSEDLESRQDLYLYYCFPNQIKSLILKQVQGAINQGYDLVFDIQVLIPQYKGEFGIDTINLLMQETFNPKTSLKMTSKQHDFYEGDKVIQLANEPEKGIMNGDIGIVEKISRDKDQKIYMIVKFDDTKVMYEQSDLETLNLAYAMSVHKSQGSEYKIVIIPLVKSYMHMLKKELIYTAITRAKQYLVVLGDMHLLKYAANHLSEKRQTTLKLRM